MKNNQPDTVEDNKEPNEAAQNSEPKEQVSASLDKLSLITSEIRFIKYAMDETAYKLSKLQQEESLSPKNYQKIDNIILSLNNVRSSANNVEAIASNFQTPISTKDMLWGGVIGIAFYLHAIHWYHEVIELKHEYVKTSQTVSTEVKNTYRANMSSYNQNSHFFSLTRMKNSASIFAVSIKETLLHPTTFSHLSKLGRNSFTLVILGAYLYKSAYGLKKAGESLVDRIMPKGP